MKDMKFFVAFFALILGISSATLTAQITVSPWQIHEGEGKISHYNPRNGDPSAYQKAKIPSEGDGGWKTAPTDADGNVFIDRSSTVNCLQQLDFTYFQTSVNIPANTKMDKFTVSYGKADDGARIYFFNSKFPNGSFDPAADLIISDGRDKTGSVNLKDKVVVGGTTRIVIVQFDDCADRNSVQGIFVSVNGQTIEPEADDDFPVTIFEHTNYGGKSQGLKEGINTEALKLGNDVVSSLKVKKCWKVTLYEHNPNNGRQLVITEDTPDLVKLNFNDIVSTIRVEKIPGCNSSASVALPDRFKVLAYSISEGKTADKDAYWFGLNNNDSRGRILSQAKLGSNAKWMEIERVNLGGDVVAFKVTNAGADMYLTARDNKEVHVEKAAGGNVPEGAKFKSVAPLTSAPGANERNFRSFQSMKFADHYLRHAGFAMFVHTNNGSELFKQDASWLIQKM